MTDLNQGTMKIKGSDSWLTVILSAAVILGAVAWLIVWATQSAYVFR